VRLGNTVKGDGIDRERLGRLSDVDTARLPILLKTVVLGLRDRPAVLNGDRPEWVACGLDSRGDVLQVADGGVRCDTFAVGAECGRVLGLGSGYVELIDTATR